jgi:hypothetical protein
MSRIKESQNIKYSLEWYRDQEVWSDEFLERSVRKWLSLGELEINNRVADIFWEYMSLQGPPSSPGYKAKFQQIMAKSAEIDRLYTEEIRRREDRENDLIKHSSNISIQLLSVMVAVILGIVSLYVSCSQRESYEDLKLLLKGVQSVPEKQELPKK